MNVVKVSLSGGYADLSDMGEDVAAGMLRLAGIHMITPMVCEAIHKTESIRKNKAYISAEKRAINDVVAQTVWKAEFVELYRFLRGKGLNPVVVKGIIIRALYPRDTFRMSADEDLWIDPAETSSYHLAFEEFGLLPVEPETDIWIADELAYIDPDTNMYIELHKSLFPSGSDAYGSLNSFFESVDCKYVTISGEDIRTLSDTDHLLYLILHAFKHFLHSGFGIRQVCDINLYSDYYGDSVDWNVLIQKLKSAHAYEFAIAIFRIGHKYLASKDKHSIPTDDWDQVDEEPMLRDILDSGLYGAASRTRVHSSNMTLQAVASRKRSGSQSFMQLAFRSVFLPLKNMRSRYPYLKKAPFLLPFAWVQRVLHYLPELTGKHKLGDMKNVSSDLASNPAESILIGQERIKLLQKYHIVG